ncbi:pro-sigmaK processing inhibitor BofA family protein [Methanimicrococcus blatticola]|uniref:SigmaK-factor processing regulatory protein BofA n=1 Tax=Methanimicrococcus blatticola TaxID=91560 RepID=A0A484F3N8_9EURY|nr:pro-sigmaK processing inhibitor BofA family protein [Methanimicrococcus blatticola]MBZ3935773.1 pro-sigmaK processing inhibitor BofA family protein [Methanimicrococcus blatticola]MCC2508107.1 pro-sigmaK processing inhibitor BofA family protein [Methanimicrococcus blatticola]TDQ68814.1 sigmaK-factor processing regulatory protein BofA [Methanimicrococcus blatticola]
MALPGLLFDIILVALAILIAYILYKALKTTKKLALNIIIGFILIIVTNLLDITSIPVGFNLSTVITILITALTGVFGALVMIILNIFGLYPFI